MYLWIDEGETGMGGIAADNTMRTELKVEGVPRKTLVVRFSVESGGQTVETTSPDG